MRKTIAALVVLAVAASGCGGGGSEVTTVTAVRTVATTASPDGPDRVLERMPADVRGATQDMATDVKSTLEDTLVVDLPGPANVLTCAQWLDAPDGILAQFGEVILNSGRGVHAPGAAMNAQHLVARIDEACATSRDAPVTGWLGREVMLSLGHDEELAEVDRIPDVQFEEP